MQCLAFIPGRDGGGREGGEVSWGLNRNHTHTHTHLNGTIVVSKPRRRTFSSAVVADLKFTRSFWRRLTPTSLKVLRLANLL